MVKLGLIYFVLLTIMELLQVFFAGAALHMRDLMDFIGWSLYMVLLYFYPSVYHA